MGRCRAAADADAAGGNVAFRAANNAAAAAVAAPRLMMAAAAAARFSPLLSAKFELSLRVGCRSGRTKLHASERASLNGAIVGAASLPLPPSLPLALH